MKKWSSDTWFKLTAAMAFTSFIAFIQEGTIMWTTIGIVTAIAAVYSLYKAKTV